MYILYILKDPKYIFKDFFLSSLKISPKKKTVP